MVRRGRKRVLGLSEWAPVGTVEQGNRPTNRPTGPRSPPQTQADGSYAQTRAAPFTPQEERAVRGAAVCSRAYATRYTHVVGKQTTAMDLREYAEAFL